MFPLIDARPPEPCLASVAAVILFFAMTDISPFCEETDALSLSIDADVL